MLRRLLLYTLFISVGLVAGLVLTGRLRTAEVSTAAPAAAPLEMQTPRGIPASALPDLTDVAQRTVSGVTNISSTVVVRTPLIEDPFFRFFFRDDDMYRERQRQSLGSGVIVSADGYVLTNSHVIGGARAEVRVGLSDQRELRATVVGTDEWTDIAVLKLDAANLPVVPWGDSSKLRVAEWVLAIGNPFQLNGTVTLGIVSATGRRLEGSLYEDFIQTDAAINPGNSGGALINARGELVGINTAIYSQSGGYQGIGFAVPSNLARQVMNEIVQHGFVRRGTIRGIQVQNLTPQIARELGAPSPRGVLLLSVPPRSRAYQEGLRQYDIVASINGVAVEDAGQLIRLVAEAEIGTQVTLGVIRQGRTREVRVTVEQASGARTRV